MPRKPTRSGNESRPTRRNLSSRVEDLGEGATVDVDDLPILSLVELFSYDPECVDEERHIYRLNGELRNGAPVMEKLADGGES